MGQYFSPPNELVAIGRQLAPGSYSQLKSQISPEEELFGLYDRGDSLVAPRLSSIKEFNHYEAQYRKKRQSAVPFGQCLNLLKSTVVLKNYSFYEKTAPH